VSRSPTGTNPGSPVVQPYSFCLSLTGSYVTVYNCIKRRILGSHASGYKEYYLLGCKRCVPAERQQRFLRDVLPPSSGPKNMTSTALLATCLLLGLLLDAVGVRYSETSIGVLFLAGEKYFSLFHGVYSNSGFHPAPPLQWVPWALSLGVKWPGRKALHTRPSSAKVKNGEATPPLLRTSSWPGAQ
jgi:hypothetical protein